MAPLPGVRVARKLGEWPDLVRPQFMLERDGARMIDAQRARAIVVQHVQAHQTAIKVFGERVYVDQALGVLDGGGHVSLPFKQAEQLFERLYMVVAQPFSLGHDPFVIATGQ